MMQFTYFGSDGSVGPRSTYFAQIAALHSAGKEHDLTTATGVYTVQKLMTFMVIGEWVIIILIHQVLSMIIW